MCSSLSLTRLSTGSKVNFELVLKNIPGVRCTGPGSMLPTFDPLNSRSNLSPSMSLSKFTSLVIPADTKISHLALVDFKSCTSSNRICKFPYSESTGVPVALYVRFAGNPVNVPCKKSESTSMSIVELIGTLMFLPAMKSFAIFAMATGSRILNAVLSSKTFTCIVS
ncbi:hypothetical protein OGAPHI_000862 [Ogataea philodendri]|uniref:Uncharacterized protein n=1 Tax=Ogataea philodendri TaxID=1378263 RepID=A0A9P8TAJ1_9ASCO|nr:uncharacterized protein OGAPHI_000862 [Ogataea philodendri]KAH3671151.1 hypothetical protein OGAPHI_000862 [Ogataea philodendri]